LFFKIKKTGNKGYYLNEITLEQWKFPQLFIFSQVDISLFEHLHHKHLKPLANHNFPLPFLTIVWRYIPCMPLVDLQALI
jgi:hypothetical protein